MEPVDAAKTVFTTIYVLLNLLMVFIFLGGLVWFFSKVF